MDVATSPGSGLPKAATLLPCDKGGIAMDSNLMTCTPKGVTIATCRWHGCKAAPVSQACSLHSRKGSAPTPALAKGRILGTKIHLISIVTVSVNYIWNYVTLLTLLYFICHWVISCHQAVVSLHTHPNLPFCFKELIWRLVHRNHLLFRSCWACRGT